MAYTTTTVLPSAVNNFYSRTLLTRAIPSFIHTRFAQVKDIPTNNSEVIKFRKYGSLTAATTALTEGVTPNGSQASYTDVTATIAQYGDFITVTDFVQITTLDPLLTELSEVLGEQAGDTLDQITRDILAAGSTVQYAGAATSRGTVAAGMLFTAAEVKEFVRTLKGGNTKKITKMIAPTVLQNTVSVRASFVGIVSEDTEFDMKDDPEFVPVNEYSNPADAMPDEVGKIDEVRFLSATTNAKVFTGEGSGSIDVHCTLIFGKEWYGISRISGHAMETIYQPLGSGGTQDPLKQRSTLGWKATFVAKILQQAFGGRVEHEVSS